MADIKTGIFAKNVQKRLNRAQEKVSGARRGRGREAGARSAGLGLQRAVRGRARGAARCGAGPGPGTRGLRAVRAAAAARRDSGDAGKCRGPADPGPRSPPRGGWPLSWARAGDPQWQVRWLARCAREDHISSAHILAAPASPLPVACSQLAGPRAADPGGRLRQPSFLWGLCGYII